MLLKALVLLGMLALCGCAADRGRVAAADANVCAGYGFKPGTDGFSSCRMQLQMQRNDHNEAARRDIINPGRADQMN
jgi:hypothetical protein